jgi:hypothetical protein
MTGHCWRPGCHHPHDTHQHYRPGLDCGSCGCRRLRRYPRPRDLWFLISVTWAVLRALP